MTFADHRLDEKALDETIDKLAKVAHDRGLNAPAIFFLELHKPLASLLHTASVFFAPMASPLFGSDRILSLQHILADRRNIEKLISKIETYSERKN